LISLRTVLYVVLSVAVSAPAFLEVYLRGAGSLTLGIFWMGVLALLWISWPRYRSRWMRASTGALSAIAVGNLVAGAAVVSVFGEPSPTLAPNLHMHVHASGRGIAPGVAPDQTITTNAHGHRTNGPIDYRHKPAGTLRLVAIGASTTEEAKLDDRKTWTYQVAQALESATGRKVEVINTALSGVRALSNHQALLEAEAYAPDIVTFLMGINDWNKVIAMQGWSPLHRFLAHFSTITYGNSPLYHALKEASGAVRLWLHPADGAEAEDDGSYSGDWMNSLERPRLFAFRPAAVDEDYARWVHRIVEECRRSRIFCLFMDQPTAYSETTPPDLRRRLWMTPPFADYTLSMDGMIHLSRLYNDWMAKEVTDNGLAFCPLADKIPATTEYLVDDCHFNENGARRVAEVVTACLLDHRAAFDKSAAGRLLRPVAGRQ
jgi:lysophospholipase L1-like esterase